MVAVVCTYAEVSARGYPPTQSHDRLKSVVFRNLHSRGLFRPRCGEVDSGSATRPPRANDSNPLAVIPWGRPRWSSCRRRGSARRPVAGRANRTARLLTLPWRHHLQNERDTSNHLNHCRFYFPTIRPRGNSMPVGKTCLWPEKISTKWLAGQTNTAAVHSGQRPSPKSGRRDSNPRHPAWEASALPTELRPQRAVQSRPAWG